MIELLPCSSCTGLCCGPVALSTARFEKIRGFVDVMPQSERKRLQAQKRKPLDCGFLDMETHRCAIYPVRPFVCEAFGRVSGMVCPVVGHLVQIMPAFEEEGRLAAEVNDRIVAVSNEIDWLRMQKK